MDTIGLRELNQNPSKAVAQVRAGATLVVTDRGVPVIEMIPIEAPATIVQRMIAVGEAKPPAKRGMPHLIEDLAPETDSLSDLILAERQKERSR